MNKKHRFMRPTAVKFLQSGIMAALAVVLIALPVASNAQTTSSSARGTITDANGAPISNATVTITHLPSAAAKTVTTGANGYYFQPGLRIGGPYEVTIAASGFRAVKVDEIFFSPGIQAPLNLTMDPASDEMEEIVVFAEAIPVRDLNNGIGSAFSASDIGNTPAQQRDVIKTMLRDPLAQSSEEGNLSVGGTNPRFNGFAIDGALQTDDFGLNDNNPEDVYSTYATVRSPINLDAIESAALVASDYDASTSGFTGGLVSVTTKSGTNEWDGSAFYYWQTDDMFGEDYDGGSDFDPGPIDEKEYGITLGGPIVKDKLFFFVSYDEFESASSSNFTDDDSSNNIAPGFFDALAPIIETATGYNPGSRPTTASTPSTSERTLVKLDWNINDSHRASLTYQDTEEAGDSVLATSYDSGWYAVPVLLEAFTGQLFSDWTDSFSTTLRINLKDFERGQNCRAGTGVGNVRVAEGALDVATVAGTPLEGFVLGDLDADIDSGCDSFRHANQYNDERLQIFAKGDYFVGDHVISAGIEYEEFDVFNVFVPNALGLFEFNSYADLLSGTADVEYTNVTSNNVDDAAARWGYSKMTFFAQDTVQVTPNLELGFGLRYERFDQSDEPVFVQSIFDTYGVDTTNNLDGNDLLLPRVSFRWTPADRTTLSGGFGLFAGGDPKVWISNSFQLPTVTSSGTFTGVDPTQVPQALLDDVATRDPVPFDYISKDFETPSDWKASVRLEQEFDIGSSEGYILTAQYLYTKTKDGFLWTNIAQTGRSDTAPGVAPDGRPIYADLDDLGIEHLIELTNHDKGESHVIALGLAKTYDFGLDFNFSYAFQDVELATEGGSSRGVSNWRGILGADRNNPIAHTSRYETEHSFKLNLGYEKDFFGSGNSTTRFDIFARRFSGDKLAHTFNVSSSNALFGRAFGGRQSPFDADVLYVPESASDPAVVYATGFDQAGFEQYVKDHVKGRGIIDASSSEASWVTMMDVRIQQDIPGLPFLSDSLGDNNFRIVLDIENFLNLLNSDWGRWVDGPRFIDNDIVTADLVLASDVALNGVDGATALLGDAPRTNCLSQSDCVYRFNSFRDRDFNFTNRFNSVYKIRLGVRFDF